VGIGDGADGAEEFAVVLREVGAGGGVVQEFAQVIERSHGQELVEFGDVGVLNPMQLAEERSQKDPGVVPPVAFGALGVGNQGAAQLAPW